MHGEARPWGKCARCEPAGQGEDLADQLDIAESGRARDVLHGHGAKGGLAARLSASLGLRSRAVTAYTPHGGSLYFNRGVRGHRLYMAAEQFLVRGTDAFTFESQFAATRFAETMDPGDRLVRVIRNGAHPGEFEPIRLDPDATDLLYLGEYRRVLAGLA